MDIISQAYAEGVAPVQAGGDTNLQMLIMLAAFGVIFYFFIFRPQAKRAKEHKNLMSSLSKGDEVLTSGGLVGKISKVSDENDFLVLALNDQTQITIKKDYVTAVLPKGTLQSL